MSDLEVCDKCGWYMPSLPLTHRCRPVEGRIADEVAAIARARFSPPVESTKLGYGEGRLTFEMDEDIHLTVAPHKDGTFWVEKVFLLGQLSPEQVLFLVDALRRVKDIP